MHIECSKLNGEFHLRVVQSYSVTEEGKVKNKKMVVKNIGPLSDFDDGQPNYLERLRESFKRGEPLIPSLAEMANGKSIAYEVPLSQAISNAPAYTVVQNLGWFLIDSIYEALGISSVVYESKLKTELDIQGILKKLVIDRILRHGNLIDSFMNQNLELFPVVKIGSAEDILKALEYISEMSDAIVMRMNGRINKSFKRSGILYGDVIDAEIELDTSRDEDKTRFVYEKQIAILVDEFGIPFDFDILSGCYSPPVFSETALSKTKGKDCVIVPCGRLNNAENLEEWQDKGYGYIVSKNLRAKDIKKWLADSEGYVYNKERTFKAKWKLLDSGERVIGYWDKEYEKIKSSSPNNTGKKTDELDSKILGCRTLVSHKAIKPAVEIVEIYNSKVIDKASKRAKMIFSLISDKPDETEIKATCLISHIALVIIRIMQLRVENHGGIDIKADEFPIASVRNSLLSIRAVKFYANMYRLSETLGDAKLLMDSFGIDLNLAFPTAADLRKLKTKFKDIGLA
ncbi:MAG: hypothetical protein LBT59_29495 [Clostridiales bacterium]|nr:hypothetical protein [Clostridiales bacterium]